MSIEIHVFFRGKLPDTAALTKCLNELGFGLSFPAPHYSLEGKSGFRPMRFGRDETGVQFFIDDGRNVVESALSAEQIAEVDPNFDRCASFRWGSAEDEMVCGLCCAAALAKLTNGVVYEETDGVLWSTAEVIEEAKKYFEEFVKKVDPTRGTRTSDIKRYLKSLLKQRSDLTLAGRFLVIRPVRHLLRGALLDRTSDKYRFNVYRYIAPLYDAESLEYSTSLNGPDFYVWKPHFEPMLIDRLAEGVFEQAGRLTTLSDFANSIATRPINPRNRFPAVITGLVLAGERERAAEIVQQVKNNNNYDGDAKKRLQEQWDSVSRNIETVCAELHAREAKYVKEMKLEHIWEPSPFPAEVPVTRRKAETSEIFFSVEPWIERPPTLLREMPEKFGDIRFAKDTLERDGRPNLLAPISRFEAGERHRDLESYVLAARLPDDLTLLLRRRTSLDRNDPDPIRYQNGPWINLVVELWGPSLVAVARASQDYDNKVLLHFDSVRIYEQQPRREIWNYFVHDNGERSISDSRSGTEIDSRAPLTGAEYRLLTCSTPGFGEYVDLVERVWGIMRHAGYWDSSQTGQSLGHRFRVFLGGLWRGGRD